MFTIEARRRGEVISVAPVVVSTRTKSVIGENLDGQGEVPFARIDELTGKAKNFWPSDDIDSRLWQKLIHDALAADLLDDKPEKWSPLGPLPLHTLGAVRENAQLEQERDRLVGQSREGAIQVGDDADGLLMPEIALLDDTGEALGAVVFGALSCVAVLPAGTEDFRLNYTPTAHDERTEDEQARSVLSNYGDGDVHRIMLWRTYYGRNSQITDAVCDAGTWVKAAFLATARGASALVLRPLLTRSREKKHLKDFTRGRRVDRALRDEAEFASRCPDLPKVQNATGNLVVAVHGTMACAVPMAREIVRNVGDAAVVRFEHDTWLPIKQNVTELVRFLDAVSADRVTLIAHSRGGLVAYRAAADTTHPNVQVVTLGTPFQGTPIADAAQVPLLGFRCLLGVIRGLAGFAEVALATRLAGFLVREVPEGIAAMEVRWSDGFRGPPPKVVATVAGNVTADTLKDTWACHFLFGTRQAFDGADNDLVVSIPSASGGLPEAMHLECDHFSYWIDEQVEALFGRVVGPEPGQLELRPDPPDPRSGSW